MLYPSKINHGNGTSTIESESVSPARKLRSAVEPLRFPVWATKMFRDPILKGKTSWWYAI